MREGTPHSGSAAVTAGDGGRAVAWLYRRSTIFLGVYLTGSALSFGVQLLMARLLGAASYGQFVYAISWAPLLLLGCNFGLRPTAVRFVAAYHARGQWSLLRGFVQTSTRWTMAASALVVTLALTAIFVVWPRAGPLAATLALVVVATPFVALGDVWSSSLRGLGAVARSQIPASIVQHLTLGIALVALVALLGPARGATLSAAAFLIAALGTVGAAGALLWRRLPEEAARVAPLRDDRAWRDVAFANVLIALFQAARAPLVVVIAASYVDAQQLAYYGAAQRLAGVMSLGLFGISALASPLLSEYHAMADFQRLQRLTRAAARGASIVAAAIALVMVGFGGPLLGLFGAGFESGYAALLVLLLGEMAAAAPGPVGFFLTMTGRHASATRIEALAAACTLALALMLIPRHGIVGAAVAVATGSIIRNGAMAVAMRRGLASSTST